MARRRMRCAISRPENSPHQHHAVLPPFVEESWPGIPNAAVNVRRTIEGRNESCQADCVQELAAMTDKTFFEPHELSAINASELDRDTPYGIRNVSQTQFSISRYYGGCTYNGRRYTYFAEFDELIRDDVLAWIVKHRKVKKKQRKAKPIRPATLPNLRKEGE